MAAVSPEHTRDEIARLAHRGAGVREFSLAAARILRGVVRFDGVCVMTMDPATLLPTGHVIENGLPDDTTPRLAEIELQETDYNTFTELARERTPAAALRAATGGALERSLRHRELRAPHGLGDELRAVFAGKSGTWGGVVLMRTSSRSSRRSGSARAASSWPGCSSSTTRRAWPAAPRSAQTAGSPAEPASSRSAPSSRSAMAGRACRISADRPSTATRGARPRSRVFAAREPLDERRRSASWRSRSSC
jgi:hypothetical protein